MSVAVAYLGTIMFEGIPGKMRLFQENMTRNHHAGLSVPSFTVSRVLTSYDGVGVTLLAPVRHMAVFG